jgi:hypothetical protein
MKYKRIIFISLLLSLIFLMCLNAISQELPFLMDLAQLKEGRIQVGCRNSKRDSNPPLQNCYRD